MNYEERSDILNKLIASIVASMFLLTGTAMATTPAKTTVKSAAKTIKPAHAAKAKHAKTKKMSHKSKKHAHAMSTHGKKHHKH